MRIVAIGGGELSQRETQPLDSLVVAGAVGHRPRALFLPTASSGSREYIREFEAIYQGLGCETRSLLLTRSPPPDDEIRAAIEWADLFYVGGGDTRHLMRCWRTRGVGRLLAAAADRGATMAGLSAGALCWFRDGFTSDEHWPDPLHGRVQGLGLLPLAACPHADSQPIRVEEMIRMLEVIGGVGVALDDCAALLVEDDRWRVVAARPGRGITVISIHEGVPTRVRVEASGEWNDLASLTGDLRPPLVV